MSNLKDISKTYRWPWNALGLPDMMIVNVEWYPKKFSFRKKKMATYLTALWKGIIFVECVSLCRSENAWKSIKYSFPGNYDWLFFWFWVLWIPDVWMNRAFASSKTKSVIILQKQSKNGLFESKTPAEITLFCSDGLSAARWAQLTFTTEKVPTFTTDFHELFLILFSLYNFL